ncbi:hypothetical protein BABINDRAFT_159191 [Babjeviella inositovora NRRL Y-12698]|uniref:Extradiol ring-cleavage dioxygenase class III enzyme subunit B domain-containing protein n=1 Tax=Babjeviella inositovora NRRL Y-12698 TaxID=984486 RepID=A0A1E3QY91_9ASCO|nr:uncharacterized protein BABINDRAFT_159191 [Babjeviella inositovora NRRL Y-12698]ODQ82649.1 hypothetical protein BABINDRAFT_159191 [Babjeviella inositovora NRRL Y-12698]
MSKITILVSSLVALIVAVIFPKLFFQSAKVTPVLTHMVSSASATSTASDITKYDQRLNMGITSYAAASPYNPSYFLSHGGPTFMYSEENGKGGDMGAFRALQKIGSHIVNDVKPAFIMVVSAHWESSGHDNIEITIPKPKGLKPDENELIYDFYGFPDHMYREQFRTRGSRELSQSISDYLNENGLKASVTARGIDHGTWVPFKVAFGKTGLTDDYWHLGVPLIQISLAHTEKFAIHEQLGGLLRHFTEKSGANGILINSGMSVHNLHDLGTAMYNHPNRPMSYVVPFHDKLRDIFTKSTDYESRIEGLEKLHQEPIFRQAHPSVEHFMPIVVADGFAGKYGKVKEVYNNASLSLGWGVYEFIASNKDVKL